MFHPRFIKRLACGFVALFGAGAWAEKPAPPVPPDRSEVWVPTNQLKNILAKYPNAVVLSREQYETLLRDAKLGDKKKPVLPRSAAFTSAKYQARPVGKVVEVTAALSVNVLTDEWAQVVLGFDAASIGSVQVDGEAALEPAAIAQGNAPASPPALLLRGRGERQITLTFTLPIAAAAGSSHLRVRLPAAGATSFQLELPPEQRVESAQPIQVTKAPEKTTVIATLPPANPVLELSWRSAGGGNMTLTPLLMANGIYTIDAEKLRIEYGLAIETQFGNLATDYRISLPADAKVLQVTGDEVEKWEVADGALRITLQPGERSVARVWLAIEMPSLAAAASATLTLPVPKIDGLTRMEGVFSVVGDAGVNVKNVTVGATSQPTERAVESASHFVASYRFNTPPEAPRVTVEKVQPRFSADLDTRVEFKPEAIFLERTVTLHQEKGEVFQLTVTLPAGEEILSVRTPQDAEPDWRLEQGKLRIRWSERASGKEAAFKIRTRLEPAKWAQLGAEGLPFLLGDAKIDGVEKITGYIALKADAAFRLEAEASETLERRDGRTTPVQGDYAWFRRQDFSLNVKVVKRTGEILATLTGYALPLEGVLDLNAQIDFQFLHSGARAVRVRVPADLAQNFHFDGPQIAERNLAGDIWTIVFQKELTGRYPLKMTAQVAVPKADGAAAESRFQTTVPVIVPLDAVRSSGVWAVEANTETEITFAAKGMNELDSLLAPRLPDYQPRHRVIGVFAWLGKEYSLALSGVRHAPAAMLTSVVDSLALDTVISTSGTERNQATYQLRTAGAQYLDVQLPEKSRLLSLTVDDELVKPVGDRADRVRVQLPAKRDATRALAVSIFYETPGSEWRRSGAYATRAPKLVKEIPVLRSTWRLFVPEGFEYMGIESNLRVPQDEVGCPLVLGPLAVWDEYRLAGALAVLGGSGISDPRSLDESLPPRLVAEAQRRASVYRRMPPPDLAAEPGMVSSAAPQTEALMLAPAAPIELPASTSESVRKLFVEARGFYDTGRFGLAKKRCEQIFAIEPFNLATRELVGKIDRAISDHGVAAFNETRADAIKDVDVAWQRPIRRFNTTAESAELQSRAEVIRRKLERIVIPRLEFREATIREAIDFLKKKSSDLDTDSPAGDRGVNIVLKLASPSPAAPGLPNPAEARITVSLTNVPLIEALRYVTGLANLKVRIEPYAVAVVPLSEPTDVLVTKEWKVAPGLILGVPTAGPADRELAKNWLTANGLTFTGGATAIYIPASSRLIVRNTQDQLDLIDTIIQSGGQAAAPAAFGMEQAQRISGLLPMKLELPKVGRVIELEGLAAAEQVEFRYEDWWSRARRLWLWFVGGALLAYFVAGERPWWRTCWVILLLTFLPYCVNLATMPICNALLAGWLISIVVQRIAARLVFAPQRKEVLA